MILENSLCLRMQQNWETGVGIRKADFGTSCTIIHTRISRSFSSLWFQAGLQ
jgi:hypothetical protein